MPKKSAHCRNGLVNVAIAGKFVDVNNIVKLLSKKYHFFNGLEPKGNEQATVNFWLQRGLCDSFYKDFSKIRAEKKYILQLALMIFSPTRRLIKSQIMNWLPLEN